MVNNKVVKAGIGYTVGNVLIRGIGFLTIPIFTRLMSTYDYGLYNTYCAYEVIFCLVLSLALNSSVKSAKIEFGERFDEYLSTIVLLVLLNSAAWFLILNVLYPWLAGYAWEYNRAILNLLVLQSCASAILVIYNAAIGVKFQYKAYLGIAMANTLLGTMASILLILFAFRNQSYMGRILGVALLMALTGVYMVAYFFRRARPRISRAYYKYALFYSLPVIPHGVSQTVLSQFDRIMIRQMVGASEAGIYSFAWNFGLIINVVINSIEAAWSPWFFEEMQKDNQEKIRRFTHFLLAGFTLFASGVMLCAPEVVKIMAPAQYWDGARLLVPIVLDVYFVFLYIIYVQVEYYYKKTGYLMLGTMLAAALNVMLNVILIPLYGYVMAAYSTLISYVCYFFFHYLISRHLAGCDIFQLPKMLSHILVCVAMGAFARVFLNSTALRWGVAAALCALYGVFFLRTYKRLSVRKTAADPAV